MADNLKPDESPLEIAARKRKQRSETILAKEGLRVDTSLRTIASDREALERTDAEVAFRAMCLIAVAMKGEGRGMPTVLRLIRDYGLARYFSERERAFVKNPAPGKRDSDRFSWRYEAAWTLLWALGYVELLGRPDRACDVAKLLAVMRDRSAARFIDEASLRGMPQILDQADLVYRYRRAVIDALVARKTPPAGLSPNVTDERHYALQWLIGRAGRGWDEVTTES